MKMNLRSKGALLLASMALAMAAEVSLAPKAAAADSAAVTTTVTAVGKKETQPQPLTRDDVQLYQGKEKVQVADWKRGDTLFLAILIDDSLESVVANQWDDLKAFMMAQPENTYIAVAYARNGAAMVAQDFTKDHALAAKALRIPLGNAGAFTSPYLAVQDWEKRWPDSNERKSLILFSSGVDYFRGSFDPIDPDLDTTIARSEEEHQHLDDLRSGCWPRRPPFVPRVQRAVEPQPSLGRNRRRIVLSRLRFAGHVEALFRRNTDASQQPIPAHLRRQRRQKGKIRACAGEHRSSERGVSDPLGSLSACRAVIHFRRVR